jgi:proprotein convertase subtilisin/kexin type 5
MKCHSSCTTCNGPTIDDCDSCPQNQTVKEGYCKCDSQNGYYNLNGVCTKDCGTKYQNPYTYECVTSCTWPYAFGFLNTTANSTYQCVISCPTSYYKKYSSDNLTGTC